MHCVPVQRVYDVMTQGKEKGQSCCCMGGRLCLKFKFVFPFVTQNGHCQETKRATCRAVAVVLCTLVPSQVSAQAATTTTREVILEFAPKHARHPKCAAPTPRNTSHAGSRIGPKRTEAVQVMNP